VPAVAGELRRIPINIFQNVHAKVPLRTIHGTVENLASKLRQNVVEVADKTSAKLVTFNAYKEGALSRGTADIDRAYAICGDWDKEFQTETFETGLQTINESGAQVIAYQTYNHTQEAPRWRIFVFLDEPVTPADYRTCWEGLNDIFSGRLDKGAKDCARLNYLPSCPTGQTREFRILNIEVA